LTVSMSGNAESTGFTRRQNDKKDLEDKDNLTKATDTDLQALGWQPHFAQQIVSKENSDSANTEASLIPLRITEVRSKTIHAAGAGGTDWLIPINPGQKIINKNDEKVAVAGDWILVEEEKQNDATKQSPPRVRKILNRKSVLKRRAPGRNTRKAQVIASNLDTVFVVSSCNQDFNVARLERYIAMVLETENVMPVIVLTKKDLLEVDDSNDTPESDEEDYDPSWLLEYYCSEATAIAGGSIPVVCLDARNQEEATSLLAPWLGPGQTLAFVGSSGVGKSTLANTLCGTEVAPTADIHTDSGQGRHTTTRRQLHFIQNYNDTDSTTNDIGKRCNNYGAILDTPGLRELQLVDASQGLDLLFADLVELGRSCKFRDCKHEGEPGCAITAAMESGQVDADRVARWFKLVAEEKLNSSDVAEGRKERERKKKLKAKKRLAARNKDIRSKTREMDK